jgi:truncated hemoglobin YjbI
MQPAEKPSLYDRLGGVYSIATVVDDFINRIMVDPRLNARWTKPTIVYRLRDSSTSSPRWSAGPQAAHKNTRASRWLSLIVT